MKEQRLHSLAKFIEENEICHMDTICSTFNISISTARRYVDELCKQGLVEKIYGGVCYITKATPFGTIPYPQRDTRLVDEKEIIGKLAASLVDSGDAIFIDSGTTTLRLVEHIQEKNLNVITNNLNVVNACAGFSNIKLTLSGGEYYPLTSSFVGEHAINSLQNYNITKAFLAATGVSLEYGFTNSAPFETHIKKTAIERSRFRYVMIDHSKWDIISLSTFTDFSEIHGIITDKKPPEKFMEQLEKHNVLVIYPKTNE